MFSVEGKSAGKYFRMSSPSRAPDATTSKSNRASASSPQVRRFPWEAVTVASL